jgi:hypothetical protein
VLQLGCNQGIRLLQGQLPLLFGRLLHERLRGLQRRRLQVLRPRLLRLLRSETGRISS